MRLSDETFTVFISHKHEDHALAVEVKKAIEGLGRSGLLNCFVSGIDITAGMDWRREIRSALAKSHLLILLFTSPSKNWDWCLFETGLYTRFDMTEVGSVVCLFEPGQAAPSPLADLQGVPAHVDSIRDFLAVFCRETWKICDDWRRGALDPHVSDEQLASAATVIAEAFARSGTFATYFACHRVVLSLSESDDIADGIPGTARVLEGPADTSAYTMSLFDLAGGSGKRTWADLLAAVRGTKAQWRRELDAQFLMALKEELFPPTDSRMRVSGTSRVSARLYRPILYSVVQGPTVTSVSGVAKDGGRRPRFVTIMIVPEPQVVS